MSGRSCFHPPLSGHDPLAGKLEDVALEEEIERALRQSRDCRRRIEKRRLGALTIAQFRREGS